MKRLFLLFLALFAQVATAAPHLPGLRAGYGGGSVALGTPAAPPPTPGPAPLVAGATPFGSWAPTSTPGVQGSGDTTNIILGWEEPPYAPITSGNNEICAMAFHRPNATEYGNGIVNAVAKVQFIANNGTPVDVTTPTESSRSPGRDMYCTNLDLTGVPNNTVVEIRIVGYPTNGQPVVMQGNYNAPYYARQYSLPLVANWTPTTYYLAPGGSDANPCTIGSKCASLNRVITLVGAVDVSNVRVCLDPGTYSMSASNLRDSATGWFTIGGCGSGNKSNVFITSVASTNSGGAKRVRYSDVSHIVDYTPGTGAQLFKVGNTNNCCALWIDEAEIDGGNCFDTNNCYVANGGFMQGPGIYMTDVNVQYVNNNSGNSVLFRNVTLDHYNADYGQNVKVIINGTIVSKPQSDWCCSVHPDLNQISTVEGGYTLIVYGFQTLAPIDSAGLFSSAGTPTQIGGCLDCAYVDVQFDNTGNTGRAGWQWAGTNPHHNVFFLRLNMTTGLVTGAFPSDRANWTIVDSICSRPIGSTSAFTYYGSASCD